MRKIFLLLAFISGLLFIYSGYNLTRQFSGSSLPFIGEIRGYEDTNPTDDYNRLVQRFQQKIHSYQEQASRDQTWYFWLSFIVTGLTAGSTLVSSIQAAKNTPADPPAPDGRMFAIIVALLTFSSTLSNFGSTHFNDLKTDETKKATELSAKLNQFYADYDKAAAADKTSVITSYARQIPD